MTRRGPLGKEAAHGFKGKVMYAPCRTLVRAPTDWDGETVAYECKPDYVAWATGCGNSGRPPGALWPGS